MARNARTVAFALSTGSLSGLALASTRLCFELGDRIEHLVSASEFIYLALPSPVLPALLLWTTVAVSITAYRRGENWLPALLLGFSCCGVVWLAAFWDKVF